ncbi:MAG: hypothetical protein KAV99_06510 [Candidatus Latescibacteria bacterium]|nr:hypothetical protein [Candidatus Latescibacterota bacterium]
MTEKREVNILDYIYIIARRWKLIIVNLLIICSVAAVISLLLPKWYTGTAMILPPKERKEEFGFAGALAELPIPVIRLGEKGSAADVVIGILKSRSVADSMVKKFDLIKLYKTDRWEEAVHTLGENTTVRRTDEGLIAVSVLDKSPVRAAQMANVYIRFLDNINRELSLDWTKERRDFVETQCDSVKAALRMAQDELQAFQKRHGIISIDAQAEATIGVAADLETEIMGLNLKLQSLKTSLGEKHPEVEFTEERIRIRQSQLASLLKKISPASSSLQLSRSDNPEESGQLSTLFIPLGSVPELKTEYTGLSLNMEVQSAILKYLQEELEKKKIETRGEMSTVQVVDWATPPEMRTKPKRKTIVLISGIFGLIFNIFAILGVEYFQALKSGGDENSEKLKKILQEFKWRKRSLS